MAAYSQIRKAVRRAVIQSLIEYFPTEAEQNELLFFSHTGGTEPSKPFVVINILSIEQIGKHSTSTLSNPADNMLYIRASYEMNVQFTFCGSTAGDMAQSFSQRINNNPFSFSSLNKEKLSVMRKSNIRRAPQKRETKWVEYFNQDVVFTYTLNTEQPVDWVEAVVIESDIKASPEDTDPSVIFSVPEGIVYP